MKWRASKFNYSAFENSRKKILLQIIVGFQKWASSTLYRNDEMAKKFQWFMGVDDDDQARENFYTKIINDKIKTRENNNRKRRKTHVNRQEQATQECCISTNE